MAVHVGLTSPPENISSAIGYLGAVRELQFGASRLDTYSGPLRIYGNLLFSQGHNFMYSFNIEFDGKALLSGRASIFIQQRIQPT
jgi:predicted hotdog family 3-hydroxylacyl-ACP dehydratase